MSKIDIIRAWKDEDYRESLTGTELPEHPAGIVELDDEELTEVRGAAKKQESLQPLSGGFFPTICLACQK